MACGPRVNATMLKRKHSASDGNAPKKLKKDGIITELKKAVASSIGGIMRRERKNGEGQPSTIMDGECNTTEDDFGHGSMFVRECGMRDALNLLRDRVVHSKWSCLSDGPATSRDTGRSRILGDRGCESERMCV